MGFPGDRVVKNSPADAVDMGSILKEEMATHSSILVWEIPRREEDLGYSPWSQRSRHDLMTKKQQKKLIYVIKMCPLHTCLLMSLNFPLTYLLRAYSISY